MNDPAIRRWLVSLIALVGSACATWPALAEHRDGALFLPPALREVSAVAAIDDRTVMCLQDEAAALYRVDLVTGAIAAPQRFGERGDFEGLATVGGDWWALRSEGVLVHVTARDGALTAVAEHALPGGHRDWEGLCADAERAQLLAMPKIRSRGGAGDQRPIYAIDPRTGRASDQPFVVFGRKALEAQCRDRGLIAADAELEVACSDLVVVPARRELLLVSSVDGLLLRVGFDGALLGGVRLDRQVVPKPEGLALMADGTVCIASEGRSGAGRLVRMPMP